MKKANKKFSKLLKITLLLCMIFSQLASPIETLAAEIVPSYEMEMVLDTENDRFVVTSVGTKELVKDANYILEITRSFEYFDGTLNENENKTTYSLVLGRELTTGYDIAHEKFNYNGTSYLDVNIYEITDSTIDFSTYNDEDYQTLLTTDTLGEKVVKIMSTSFEEDVTYNETSLTFEVIGEDGYIVCDTTSGYKCNVTKSNINNVVEIRYTTANGNLNPNVTYHTVLKVNGVVSDLVTADLNVETGVIQLDFSKLLPGVYSVEYSVRDDENTEVLTNSVEFTYSNEEVLDRVEFIKNSVEGEFAEEIFYSYTLLTDEEKSTLGNNYRFLDNPLAFIFDSLVSTSSENIVTDYNLFDADIRYHVVSSENFLGAFYDGFDAYRVSDVKEELSALQLPYTSIKVVDANGDEVEDATYIQNGMKLVVTILGEQLEYDFLVYGDVDGNYVEISDLSALINKVLNNDLNYYDKYNLDLNSDGIVDITDISVLGFNIYEQDYVSSAVVPTATITPVIESDKEELYVGDTFEVLVSLEGFDENTYINTIEGYLSYNASALRLDNVECLDEYFVGNYLNSRFIYASNYTFASEEKFIKLTFTALTEGTYNVSLVGMNLLADGVILTTNDSNNLAITVNRVLHSDASLKSLTSSTGYFDKSFNSEVLEYTLYVDSSVNSITLSGELNDAYANTTDLKKYTLTGDNTQISINVTAEDGTVRTYKVNVVKVYKSSNNNLSSLVIDGYEIDFDKNTLEYKITVGSDVTSLDITALVEDYSAWAKIEGNENFQEGENTVTITVYAQDGSTKTYKILVNKEKAKAVVSDEDDDEEEQSSSVNSEKVIIIILIILVVIGLLYLIFKKDEEEDIKIEQVKPKKEENTKPEEVKNNNNKKNNNKNKK